MRASIRDNLETFSQSTANPLKDTEVSPRSQWDKSLQLHEVAYDPGRPFDSKHHPELPGLNRTIYKHALVDQSLSTLSMERNSETSGVKVQFTQEIKRKSVLQQARAACIQTPNLELVRERMLAGDFSVLEDRLDL